MQTRSFCRTEKVSTVSPTAQDSDDGFVGEENDGGIGDDPDEMSPHPTVESVDSLLEPHHAESLEEVVVASL